MRVAQGGGNFELNKFNISDIFAGHARLQELARKGDDDGSRTNAMEKSVSAFLREFPWAAGGAGAKAYQGTRLGEFDAMDVELRDDEALLIGAGKPLDADGEIRELALAGLASRQRNERGGADGSAELR